MATFIKWGFNSLPKIIQIIRLIEEVCTSKKVPILMNKIISATLLYFCILIQAYLVRLNLEVYSIDYQR